MQKRGLEPLLEMEPLLLPGKIKEQGRDRHARWISQEESGIAHTQNKQSKQAVQALTLDCSDSESMAPTLACNYML